MMTVGMAATQIRAFQTMAALGDSHTFNETTGLVAADFHPAKLEINLRRAGVWVNVLNLGNSGFNTGEVLARALSSVTPGAAPNTIGLIYAGTNDAVGGSTASTVQASPSPTTTTFSVEAGKGARYLAGNNITINGTARVVESVATDAITISVALSGAPSAGQVVMPDTTANLVATANALIAKRYTKIILGLQHYLNFSVSGDTVNTPSAGGAALRLLQQAAADQVGSTVTVADFYSYMRGLIVAGTYVQGSASWHVADLNSHLNATGQQILADCIYAAMPADWIASLR